MVLSGGLPHPKGMVPEKLPTVSVQVVLQGFSHYSYIYVITPALVIGTKFEATVLAKYHRCIALQMQVPLTELVNT